MGSDSGLVLHKGQILEKIPLLQFPKSVPGARTAGWCEGPISIQFGRSASIWLPGSLKPFILNIQKKIKYFLKKYVFIDNNIYFNSAKSQFKIHCILFHIKKIKF
jgi:hypothetical protein